MVLLRPELNRNTAANAHEAVHIVDYISQDPSRMENPDDVTQIKKFLGANTGADWEDRALERAACFVEPLWPTDAIHNDQCRRIAR